MFAKLIEGKLHCAPLMVRQNDVDIYNPDAELLESLGYKKVIETDYPVRIEDAEAPDEAPTYKCTYEEREHSIYRVWIEQEPEMEQTPEQDPDEETLEPSPDPIEERLNELTDAVIELAELVDKEVGKWQSFMPEKSS